MARSYGAGLASFLLLVAAAGATQFKVGGQKGWSVPDSNAISYNQWAGMNRFQIGDQLLFVYPKDTDSVLLVEAKDYNTCNTSSYTRKFDDGNTVFTFDHAGVYFFISGTEDNCRKNEKLIVIVMSGRTNQPPTAPPPAPTPSSPSSPPPSTASAPAPSMPPAPTSTPPPPGVPAPTTATPSSPPSAAPASAPATPPSASSPSSSPSPSTSPQPPQSPSTSPSGSPQPPSPSPSGSGQPSAPSPSGSPPSPSSVPSGSAPSIGGSPPPPAASQNSAAAALEGIFTTSLGACLGYFVLAI